MVHYTTSVTMSCNVPRLNCRRMWYTHIRSHSADSIKPVFAASLVQVLTFTMVIFHSMAWLKSVWRFVHARRRRSLLGRAGSCPPTFQSLWAKPILCPPTFCGWKSIFSRFNVSFASFCFSFVKCSIFSSANPMKMLLLELLFWPWICTNSSVGWGFAPWPHWGSLQRSQYPLTSFKGTYF